MKLYNTYHSDKDGKTTNAYDTAKAIGEKDLRIIIVYEESGKVGKEIKIPKRGQGSEDVTINGE